MRLSIIINRGTKTWFPEGKLYLSKTEWEGFGKPRAFVYHGQLTRGLRIAFSDVAKSDGRIFTIIHKKLWQIVVPHACLGFAHNVTGSVRPINVSLAERNASGIRLNPIAETDFEWRPSAAPRKKNAATSAAAQATNETRLRVPANGDAEEHDGGAQQHAKGASVVATPSDEASASTASAPRAAAISSYRMMPLRHGVAMASSSAAPISSAAADLIDLNALRAAVALVNQAMASMPGARFEIVGNTLRAFVPL